MKSKIIFLDIDGVLCSMRSAAANNGYPVALNAMHWDKFDQVAINLLKQAIRHTGASVVLSSNWRNDVNIQALEWRLGIRIEDVTREEFKKDEPRGAQIRDWLAVHPEVERYAILDDDEDFLPNQMDKLCRTSMRNGFLIGHYDELCEMLGEG